MTKEIRQIAIYGKGGIGKSTTSSNISAALSVLGYKVMQVGCDPKSDSTNTLRNGKYIPTVLDTLRAKGKVTADEIVFKGFNGVYCVEAGGPAPGVGCAGRGIITAVEQLKLLKIFEDLDIDVVLYDVLGDVVCGGFAVPIREGIAKHVFTVASSDFMAIYAANNLFAGIRKYSAAGGALLGGVIANSINAPYSRAIVDDFAGRTRTKVVEYVPRSVTVTQAELQGKTVIEMNRDSPQGKVYLRLAESIASHEQSRAPAPMSVEDLHQWAAGWAAELLKVETGEIGGNAEAI